MSTNERRQRWPLVLLCALAVAMLAGSSHAAVVGWWSMDDANYPPGTFDPTTLDSTNNGNDGHLYGTTSTGAAAGYLGHSATIGNVGAISCGTDASVKPTAAGYSFATWVKFDELGHTWQLIGSDWNDAGPQYFYHFASLYDNLDLYYGNDTGGLGGHIATTSAMVADAWTHVAFTITPAASETEPGEITLYRDGDIVGTGSYAFTSLPVTPEPVILGAKGTAGAVRLHGELDETAIWTSAISAADVAALAGGTAPSSISTATLGGYWQYENAADSPPPNAAVADTSGLGHDGVMTPDRVDPFLPADGVFGGAVRLSGPADYITIDDIDGITEELTISTWIKPDDVNGLQVVNSQWNDGDQADKAWQILMIGDTAHFYISQPGGGIYAPVSVAGIAPGEWTNLTFTMKANDGATIGKVQAYKDGTLVGEADYDMDSLPDSSVPLVIGNRAYLNNPDQSFNGLVDDVALFDKALSASEVNLLCTQGVAAIPEPSMLALAFGALASLLWRRNR